MLVSLAGDKDIIFGISWSDIYDWVSGVPGLINISLVIGHQRHTKEPNKPVLGKGYGSMMFIVHLSRSPVVYDVLS